MLPVIYLNANNAGHGLHILRVKYINIGSISMYLYLLRDLLYLSQIILFLLYFMYLFFFCLHELSYCIRAMEKWR